MKLGAALLAWLLLAPAASAAPRPPFKLRTEAKSATAMLVTWRNRSRVARPQLAWRRPGSPKRSRKTMRRP